MVIQSRQYEPFRVACYNGLAQWLHSLGGISEAVILDTYWNSPRVSTADSWLESILPDME
jgi:hypothetical protein